MPTSVAGWVCVNICPICTFTWKQDTLKYGLRLGHLISTIFPLSCWFAVKCASVVSDLHHSALCSVGLESVSTEDAPLSVSILLLAPLTSSSVSLSVHTSGLDAMVWARSVKFPITCLLSFCCAFSSC